MKKRKCQICNKEFSFSSNTNSKNCEQHRGLMKKNHKVEASILYRKCVSCNEFKESTEFYFKKTARGSSWCISCFNKGTYFYQKNRALSRKLELIKQAGGACNICGYKKNISALVFHHTDPSKKDFPLDARTMGNGSLEAIKNEFEKCILLCHNCHTEHHYPHFNDLI